MHRDAIARKRRALGEGHHEVAATLNNLAALLHDDGRIDLARETSREAVALVALALLPDHPVRVGCEALARRIGA